MVVSLVTRVRHSRSNFRQARMIFGRCFGSDPFKALASRRVRDRCLIHVRNTEANDVAPTAPPTTAEIIVT
jgi:hypothetical protein